MQAARCLPIHMAQAVPAATALVAPARCACKEPCRQPRMAACAAAAGPPLQRQCLGAPSPQSERHRTRSLAHRLLPPAVPAVQSYAPSPAPSPPEYDTSEYYYPRELVFCVIPLRNCHWPQGASGALSAGPQPLVRRSMPFPRRPRTLRLRHARPPGASQASLKGPQRPGVATACPARSTTQRRSQGLWQGVPAGVEV